ncbi:hypothetical protein R1T43_18495 [Alteromonas sp. CI.11.F.A3]|uniref:hypothetical protein n=1 Tax=Alteromonas sp. CI.11.F.A3 TaxID=3079555 RepID=UPI0029439B7A|nr:hypothetical protein [Alteromonas sp. CI.11.F.A3]WOI37152.1 hypothetical protein R1T43_18495 [Alteromonas sp. CI.11.F.A3]
MAIETSTQGTINSLLSAVPSAGGNSTSTTAEEAATTSQSLPSMFAALLSNEEASNDETSSSQSSTSTSQFDTSLLSNLVTDDAISLMQNQLLGALQNNVFAALTASASTSSADTAAQASSSTSTSTADSTAVEAASTETDLPTTSRFDSMMTSAFGEDGLGLQDGFDTLNIVNHLPIVSDIYEATTSSHIAAASSMAGSFLYGGLGGLLYNAVDLTVEGLTGKSISNNLWDAGKQIINGNAATESTGENSLMVDEADGETSSTAASDVYEFVRRQVGG